MKVGIIGTGNMGRILIEALMESSAISPSNLIITNRTIEKAYAIKDQYPEVNVYTQTSQLIKDSSLIFICVKPLDIFSVLSQYKQYFTRGKCAISITSPISVDQLESVLQCSCARVIPSITNRALSGVSLLSFGKNCDEGWQRLIYEKISSISTPVMIEENITRVSSDIVSCGPAFFSYLTQRFINGAVEETEIDQETATILASEMLVGLGELLKKEIYTLPTLQEKVCVKGGITGEGISALEENLGDVFQKLFRATHEKFDEDLEGTRKQFGR
jgi:competence protein ComER